MYMVKYMVKDACALAASQKRGHLSAVPTSLFHCSIGLVLSSGRLLWGDHTPMDFS